MRGWVKSIRLLTFHTMKNDNIDKKEQTVYILNGITLLPHFNLPYYVAPGFTKDTPTKLWTVNQLLDEGAEQSTAFLWPRGLLAQANHGWSA